MDCCPWHENHTDQDPQGAGYGPPNSGIDEDGIPYVYARFHCFHGHCADKGISDLYEYSISEGYDYCEDDIFYFNHDTLVSLTNEIINKTQNDPGHCFEPLSLKILKQLKKKFIPDWQRVRTKFKNIPDISITSLEKEINKSASKENLEQTLQVFNNAFEMADVEILNSMTSDNYTHTNGGWKSFGKEDWLGYMKKRKIRIENGELQIASYEMKELSIQMHGLSAFITGKIVMEGIENRESFNKEIRVSNFWVFENEEWKRAGFHDTRIESLESN